ncbi:TetR/AcrR family transcriptional regulator [Acidocella sp.]|uniref:TetR/AcrR family transcriptional regulator n=1 Tax=Acidocella sp. TaxID=50710 RepID=UPI003D08BF84
MNMENPSRKPRSRLAEDPAPRLETLLDAAEHVFLSKGYHNATMSEIARQAGMSKRTVYLLVQSKGELFGELLAHRQSRLRLPPPQPGWTMHDTLCAYLNQIAKFILDPAQIAITRLVIAEYAHSPDFNRVFFFRRMRKAKAHLETSLLELADLNGGERCSRAEIRELVSMLFGMALGDFYFGALSGLRTRPSLKTLEARIDRAVGIFLSGVCSHKS